VVETELDRLKLHVVMRKVLVVLTMFVAVGCSGRDNGQTSNSERGKSELRFSGIDGALLDTVETSTEKNLYIFDSGNVHDEHLEFLSRCHSVTSLFLVRVGIRGEGLRYVGRMAQLEHLSITDCPIKSESLRYLGNLRVLKQLHLNKCSKLKDADIAALLRKLLYLEIINLDDVPMLSDVGLMPLLDNDRLRYLRLSGTEVSSEFIRQLEDRGVDVDS
jgi:hypothetical protein